jgi:peptide chain release factor 1
MFERIEIFDKRYAELNRRLYEPDVAANPDEYQKVMKEIMKGVIIMR